MDQLCERIPVSHHPASPIFKKFRNCCWNRRETLAARAAVGGRNRWEALRKGDERVAAGQDTAVWYFADLICEKEWKRGLKPATTELAHTIDDALDFNVRNECMHG